MYIKRKFLVPIHVRKWECAQLGNAQVGRAKKNCVKIFCAQVGTTHSLHFFYCSTKISLEPKTSEVSPHFIFYMNSRSKFELRIGILFILGKVAVIEQ